MTPLLPLSIMNGGYDRLPIALAAFIIYVGMSYLNSA